MLGQSRENHASKKINQKIQTRKTDPKSEILLSIYHTIDCGQYVDETSPNPQSHLTMNRLTCQLTVDMRMLTKSMIVKSRTRCSLPDFE